MYECKHCEKKLSSLDDTPEHDCFIGKMVYLEENGMTLFASESEKSSDLHMDDGTLGENTVTQQEGSTFQSIESGNSKQQAVWDKHATMALLALYEANQDTLDHPKKKGKIWSTIGKSLLEFGIQMTEHQVRWKMNALMKRYKEVLDNNCKTGRGTMKFEWFDVMDEFLRKRKNTTSQVFTLTSNHTSSPKSSTSIEELPSCSKTSKTSVKQKVKAHGTGSCAAATKNELEKQWLKHLTLKEERDKVKDTKIEQLMECKKDAIKLKRKQIAMKEKELEQKQEIAASKTREKRKRHDEIMAVEKLKYKLLKKLIGDKENKNRDTSDESD